jgi:tRNA pseudouridine38-40 synthase
MQRNPGAVTIEDELEKAIVAAGGISDLNAGDFAKVQWMRAARTDKGVSAVGQCVSLRMVIDPPGVIDRVNAALPEGFEFFGYERVTGGFNAKTMCDRRRYEYVVPVKAFDPRACKARRDVELEKDQAQAAAAAAAASA